MDCADAECCSFENCKLSPLCLTSHDPIDILLRKQPPAVTASFFQRTRFIVEEGSVQNYAEVSAFNARWVLTVISWQWCNGHCLQWSTKWTTLYSSKSMAGSHTLSLSLNPKGCMGVKWSTQLQNTPGGRMFPLRQVPRYTLASRHFLVRKFYSRLCSPPLCCVGSRHCEKHWD